MTSSCPSRYEIRQSRDRVDSSARRQIDSLPTRIIKSRLCPKRLACCGINQRIADRKLPWPVQCHHAVAQMNLFDGCRGRLGLRQNAERRNCHQQDEATKTSRHCRTSCIAGKAAARTIRNKYFALEAFIDRTRSTVAVLAKRNRRILSSRHFKRSPQSHLLKQPVIRKIDSQKQGNWPGGTLPIPLVTIKTGIKAQDGREEILSEYLCDHPGCPNVATHILGCVVEISAVAMVCEEHAGQKPR